jgi:hypothetical protein
MRISLRLRVLLGLLALLVPATAATGAAHADGDGAVSVAISQVDLDGPTIADVTVTVTNGSPSRMSKVAVELSGPTGWLVHPSRQELTGSIRPGDSWSAPFRIQVPEQRSGFRTHTFVATVTYRGGDGAGTAIGRRVQRTGEALPDLAAGRDNVGITSESDPAPGDFDGDGNSFSAEKLADVGLTPGGTVAALGATFTWPDVPPGTPDNVRAAGQGIELDGEGSHIAFLGSGSSLSAVGTATVLYTDGTTSSGTLGFPNWSFQEADAHGATLVASSTGRNRQSGYGDAAYAYRVFAHAIPVDPGKTVDVVVLPGNASIHVFDLELVD